MLVVNFEGLFSLEVIVGHAPCASPGRTIERVHLDANAPLSDQESNQFGMHHAETMNPQGHIFQEFLLFNNLYVPSTFSLHEGLSWTWRHPRGHGLRRDYVIVNSHTFQMLHRSFVLSDFDAGFGHAKK